MPKTHLSKLYVDMLVTKCVGGDSHQEATVLLGFLKVFCSCPRRTHLSKLQDHVALVVVRDELEVLDRRLRDTAVEVQAVRVELSNRVGEEKGRSDGAVEVQAVRVEVSTGWAGAEKGPDW